MKISIAIPDSTLIDEFNQLEKTRKISSISRACSIFRTETIYIYQEKEGNKKDRFLLSTILRYLETPQYLRRLAFHKMDALKFAGITQPLKTLHHSASSNIVKIKAGDIREGLVINSKGKRFVHVGFNKLIPYFGKEKTGKRITIKFTSDYPNLSMQEIPRSKVQGYWGYQVKETGNIHTLLSKWNHDIIFTSKKGKTVNLKKKLLRNNTRTLIVFGSPRRGLFEILGSRIKTVPRSSILNFFPNQGTETVRLEEAILGTLTILNSYDFN